MKKKNISVLLLLALGCTGAQAKEPLDSLRYILPEFSRGMVIFNDRQVSQGELNISPLDQGVYCLSPQKDTLYASGNSEIVSVSVQGRTFLKWKDSFIEMLTTNAETGVGISRSTGRVNNAKAGAFGTTSTTSSIRSFSVNPTSGVLTDLIIDDPRNYVYTKVPYLYHKGKFLFANKQAFKKLFPEQKEYIENIWEERGVMSSDIDSVLAFYHELLDR